MKAFLIALQFLTRLPVRLGSLPLPREMGHSLLFYPLVGLILGLLLTGLGWMLVSQPPLLAAALLLTAWVALTGALHIDGLADSADAWAGGNGEPERVLEIMKDPNAGPAGVTVVLLTLLLKFAALVALLDHDSLGLLWCVPLLGRVSLPLLLLSTAYVRPGGLGASLAAELSRWPTVIVVIASYLVVVIGGGMPGLIAATGALILFVVLRRFMRQHIGGTTGDTAGALVELSEAAALVCLAMSVPFLFSV